MRTIAKNNYNLELGNVSDVLLKLQQPNNQYNTKELPHYIPLPIIEIGVLKVIICSK